MRQASRDEVMRAVAAEPGWFKRSAANGVLALLGASALAPVIASVAGGESVAMAIAGVAGNIGSSYLANLIEKAADRLKGKSAHPPAPDMIRDALAAELLRALEKSDSAAEELNAALTALLIKVDGFTAAVEAAQDDLRSHLLACSAELIERQLTTLAAVRDVSAEQRRQAALLEEMANLLRRLGESAGFSPAVTDHGSPTARPHGGLPASTTSGSVPATRPLVVVAPDGAIPPPIPDWHGGADIVVGSHAYLLYDRLLEVWPSADHTLIHRQAQGQRIYSVARPGDRYVWLRQAEMRRDTPGAAAALAVLAGEYELLRTLGASLGLPGIIQLDKGRTTTLVLPWPTSRDTGVACETLDAFLDRDGVPLDPWRLSRLCDGIAGLCPALARLHDLGAAHRSLTLSGIIMLDTGRLVLRDLGLAAREPEPGEGPADYQAPEQRRRSTSRPGPATDVYQLGAIVYHLATGYPPHSVSPPPMRAHVPKIPESLSVTIGAALAGDAGERPSIHQFATALRSPLRGLSGGS